MGYPTYWKRLNIATAKFSFSAYKSSEALSIEMRLDSEWKRDYLPS